jgi:thiol-disulfide isomerase/thioredoxin
LTDNFIHIHILVFAYDFCPDCQAALPVIHKMAEMSDFVDWKIVDRDVDKTLFKKYHINNKGLIPMVLFLNHEFFEIERWVERSTLGYQMVYEAKKAAEGMNKEDYKIIKTEKFRSNSARLFQENINEIFSALQRAVYIVNAGKIEIKS